MEDPDIYNMKRKLRETRELVERNNEILQKIHRYIKWSRIGTIFYWVILIGIAVGAFYFLEPYWESMSTYIESFQAQFEGFRSFGQ